MSPEMRRKLSEMGKRAWGTLSPEERERRVEKVRAGLAAARRRSQEASGGASRT